MNPVLADILMHAGIGSVFACTGACTQHFCKHTVAKLALGGVLIIAEAAVMVPLVG